VSDFEVMQKISRANGKIGSAPLSNLIELKRNKRGYDLTIGISHEWGDRLALDQGNVVGALYLIDKAEFLKAKEEANNG
jgi:hypothetical protein